MFEILVLRFFGWAALAGSVVTTVVLLIDGNRWVALYFLLSGLLMWAVLLAFALIAEKLSDIADHLKRGGRTIAAMEAPQLIEEPYSKPTKAKRTAEPYDDEAYWAQRRATKPPRPS